MNGKLKILILGVALAALSGTAVARDHIGVTLSFGVPAPYVYTPPVVVAPAPSYYYEPAPVYYQPRPVYYDAPRAYYYAPPRWHHRDHDHGLHRGHRDR